MANAQLIDPLADLKAEIAAEDAAAAQSAPPADPIVEGTLAEEAKLAEEEARVAAEEKAAAVEEAAADAKDAEDVKEEEEAPKPAKKARKKAPEERMVPVERLNEYAVRVRMLEREKEELERKLNPPPEPPPQPELTPEQIRAEARRQARFDLQLEAFVLNGHKKYGQKEFDAACDKIAKLIGPGVPTNLVAIAIEATRGTEEAGDAIMALAANDAPEIEAFLKSSEVLQAADLREFAKTYAAKSAADDDEPAPKPRRKRQVEIDEDEELEPLRPLKGATAIDESLGDEVPPDVWFKRFEEQIMNKKLPH